MNLTELLVTQKNVDEISNRFGLSEEQTLEAMAAVIPAFSEGLKRQTSSPENAAKFIQALASGQHGRYADNPSLAMEDDGLDEGNAILSHLFGNKKVSRAVAKQAAAETGIGDSMFKSLLPVMANMVMGNIFKGATTSNISSSSPAKVGGLGDLLTDALTGGGGSGGGLLGQILGELAGGMLEGGGGGTKRRRQTSTKRRRSGQPNILEDLLGEVLGGGTTQRRRRTTRSRTRTSPGRRTQRNSGGGMLDGILDELLGGGGGNTQRRTRRKPTRSAPMPRKSRRPRRGRTYEQKSSDGGLGEIFGDFLEPGGNSSSRQRKQTGSIFDEFLES